MPITRVQKDVGLHINTVFNYSLLYMILEGEGAEALSATDRQTLRDLLDSWLSTPEVKVVRFTGRGKETYAPRIVHKPWGMELWLLENEVFGAKFIYIMAGEHESVQVHQRKRESQLYFGPGDVLHLWQSDFETLRKQRGLAQNAGVPEIESFIQGLPFVSVDKAGLVIRSIPVGVVHTSRPTEGLIMHLEVNAGEQAASPTVTTRLLDKYTDTERERADLVKGNWWGPRLPVSDGTDVFALDVALDGRTSTQTRLSEVSGVVRIEETPSYVIDRLNIATGESRTILGNAQSPGALIVLEGALEVEKGSGHYPFEAGEVYELPVSGQVTLTARRSSQVIHIYAPEVPVVRTLVQRAKEDGEAILFVAPQTPLIVDAAILAAKEKERPIVFIPSRNQVDLDKFGSGYVLGWNQERFVKHVRARSRELGYPEEQVYFYRDHGGPWQRDEEYSQAIPSVEAMEQAKASLLADLKAGFSALHIDATRSPISSEWDPAEPGKARDEIVLKRTVDLIEYAENQRQELGLPPVAYEVRGERKHWDGSSVSSIDEFLRQLRELLRSKRFKRLALDFVSVNPSPLRERGTQQAIVQAPFLQQLSRAIEARDALVKFHNGDFMLPQDRKRLPTLGIYAVNVAPELAMTQTRVLLDLADEEVRLLRLRGDSGKITPSNFRDVLTEAVLKGGRWRKWIPYMKGWDEVSVRSDAGKLKQVVEFNGHYAYGDPAVIEAMGRLETTISALKGNTFWLSIQNSVKAAIIGWYGDLATPRAKIMDAAGLEEQPLWKMPNLKERKEGGAPFGDTPAVPAPAPIPLKGAADFAVLAGTVFTPEGVKTAAGLEETRTTVFSPVSATFTGTSAPVVSSETSVTKMVRDWGLNQLPELRVVVVSAAVAQAHVQDHPILAQMAGRAVRMGDTWFIVLPEQATGEQVSQMLEPIATDTTGKSFSVWEYFSSQKDPALQLFDRVAGSISDRVTINEQPVEKLRYDLMAEIVAALRGIDPAAVQEEDIRRLEETLPTFV